MSISRRYKQIRFKDFSGGEGEEFLRNIASFFKSSNIEINLKTKKVKISDIKSYDELAETGNTWNRIITAASIGDYILFATDTGTDIKIYRSNKYGAFALIHTFAGKSSPNYAFVYKNKWYIDFESSLAYTSNLGSSFTEIDTNAELWDTSGLQAHTIDGSDLYVVDAEDSHIYKSSDGINFELYYDGAEYNQVIINMFILDGYMYVIGGLDDTYTSFLGRFENDELIILKRFYGGDDYADFLKFENKLIIAYPIGGKIEIYSFDRDKVKKITNIEDDSFDFDIVKCLHSDDEKCFIAAGNYDSGYHRKYLFCLTKNNKLFHLKTFASDENITTGFNHLGSNNFQIRNLTDKKLRLYSNHDNKFEASGYIESSIIDKGEIVPKQLILRHKPLPASVSVKLYVKKDRASSWGSAVLTSDTDGAVKKKYDFPGGNVYDFIQFKIELLTTDDTKTPEDIDLTFLYKPVGLEVAN